MSNKGSERFQPRARIIKLLGEQLITDEIIATVELVKNSYDADATKIEIIFDNVNDRENGMITIRDNGIGMSLNTIINAWFQLGTDFKQIQREEHKTTLIYNRPILGEKGVGRFAAQKLGNKIILTTRVSNDELETQVELDWKLFDKNALLSEIPIDWIRTKPTIFKDNSTGTEIEIRDLQKSWDKEMVFRLAQKLQSLQSPFKAKSNFEIIIKSNNYPDIQKEIKYIDEYLDNAIYSLIGNVNEKGEMSAEYTFFLKTFKEYNRKEHFVKKDIKDTEYFNSSRKNPICGKFEFKFYVWDLDHATLEDSIGKKNYDNYIKPFTGIRIYREYFRIWPYGEEGNDWLNLDIRRVNTPYKYLSNNQIVGIVEITNTYNSNLKDKTDREGLIDNIEFRDFKNLVLSAINELEIERRKDKSKIDNLRERKKGRKLNETFDNLEELKNILIKNNCFEKYKNQIENIEKSYNFEIQNIQEPLILKAGIGVAFQMPAHEIQIQLQGLREILESFENDMKRMGLYGRIFDKLNDIKKIIETLDEVSQGALELSRRKLSTFSLESTAKFAEKIKKPELDRANVKIIYDVIDKLSVYGYQNFAITCFLNLIDNSIWWLRRIEKDRLIKVTIKKDINGNASVIFSDNGPGFDPSDLDYLGEAYYTRKINGTGLGLYICKRAMNSNKGKIEFSLYDGNPNYLKGANIILTFEKGVK
jgi:signal transduction histidine kinase